MAESPTVAGGLDGSSARRIDCALLALVALDFTLSAVAFLSPGLWFRVFHGVAYVDPQGFLRRCAANWAAFALFQAVAYVKWREKPHWLAVVAGLRLSDIFTDWAYLYFAADITWFGRASLSAVSPMNLWVGWFFLRSFSTALSGASGK